MRETQPTPTGRAGGATIVPGLLERHGPLRLEVEEASETIWALASPELYLLLSEQRGWSRTRYAEWLADSLAALLLVSQSVPTACNPS